MVTRIREAGVDLFANELVKTDLVGKKIRKRRHRTRQHWKDRITRTSNQDRESFETKLKLRGRRRTAGHHDLIMLLLFVYMHICKSSQ